MLVLTVDEPKQKEILLTPSSNITPLEYQEVFRKLEDIISLYVDAVGLAAPQIGILKRAFVVRWEGRQYRFANAVIEPIGEGAPLFSVEACLSIPNREFYVRRPSLITVTDDVNGIQTFEGFLARIIQHENDHTQGVTLEQSGLEISDR